MHILYLTSGFPYPLTTGRLRHYHLLRELHDRHTITLLSLADPSIGEDDLEAVRPFADVRVVRRAGRSAPRSRMIGERLSRLAGRTDPSVVALGDQATRLVEDGPVDVVVYAGRRAAPVLDRLGGVPIVADLCDATSLALAGRAAVASRRLQPVLRLRAAAARRTERRIAAAATALVFATTRDRDGVLGPESHPERRGTSGDSQARVAIVPNGMDVTYWKRAAPQLGERVVFTGGMDYPPNIDAAVRLARHILPRLRAAGLHPEIVIAGRDPHPDVRALGELEGVTVTGTVPDMRPILDGGAVFAAPLRFGAGIQNKLLEALAMEVPIVATTLAAEGLRTAAGLAAPVTVADDDETFAAAIAARLVARGDDPRPFAEGRAFVEANFAWPAVATTLEKLLHDVARPVVQA